MLQLHETGYLRIKQIIGDPKAEPPIPALIPISKSSWYAGIKDGIYSKSIKLSKRSSAWTVESIRKLIDDLAA